MEEMGTEELFSRVSRLAYSFIWLLLVSNIHGLTSFLLKSDIQNIPNLKLFSYNLEKKSSVNLKQVFSPDFRQVDQGELPNPSVFCLSFKSFSKDFLNFASKCVLPT